MTHIYVPRISGDSVPQERRKVGPLLHQLHQIEVEALQG